MAVLGKSEIIKKLSSREIVVSPLLSFDQIGDSAIDLRLGNVAKMVRARGLSHVDPQKYISDGHGAEQGKRQKLERHDIPFREQFLLHPGTLALVPTLEWIKLSNNIQGVVTARSSWAREGLSIATATFINPGYRGIVTLELANLGQIPIALYPGLRLAQIAFYALEIDLKRTKTLQTSQFNMSFEPNAGDIIKGDEKFIP